MTKWYFSHFSIVITTELTIVKIITERKIWIRKPRKWMSGLQRNPVGLGRRSNIQTRLARCCPVSRRSFHHARGCQRHNDSQVSSPMFQCSLQYAWIWLLIIDFSQCFFNSMCSMLLQFAGYLVFIWKGGGLRRVSRGGYDTSLEWLPVSTR